MEVAEIIMVAFVAGIGTQLSAWFVKKVRKHYKKNKIKFKLPDINLEEINLKDEKKDVQLRDDQRGGDD